METPSNKAFFSLEWSKTSLPGTGTVEGLGLDGVTRCVLQSIVIIYYYNEEEKEAIILLAVLAPLSAYH